MVKEDRIDQADLGNQEEAVERNNTAYLDFRHFDQQVSMDMREVPIGTSHGDCSCDYELLHIYKCNILSL